MNFRKILSLYFAKLYEEFFLVPIVGCELEFYTHIPHGLLATDAGLIVVPEEGLNQAELRLGPTQDCLKLADQIEYAKKTILGLSAKRKEWTSFEAKPFEDRPGSAMQIHLNFMHKNKFEQGRDPKYLMHAIAGLLHTLNDVMPLFAPKKRSYARFVRSMNTPTKVSWGRNNRTAALRVITNCEHIRRVEHRVPGADADAHAVLAAIMFGAYLGVKNQLQPITETYGLTFHEDYNLAPLINDLTIAQAKLKEGALNRSLISSCYFP